MQLVLRQRRAQRRHGIAKARLAHRDHIHIAFADDQPAAFAMAQRLARRLVAVEHGGLVEERRVAGVEVFRLGIGLQRPATKGNDPAARIGDRKHQPPTKHVIRLAAPVAFLEDARFQQFSVGKAFLVQVRPRPPPIVRCVAQPVLAPAGRGQPPALQIAARARAF